MGIAMGDESLPLTTGELAEKTSQSNQSNQQQHQQQSRIKSRQNAAAAQQHYQQQRSESTVSTSEHQQQQHYDEETGYSSNNNVDSPSSPQQQQQQQQHGELYNKAQHDIDLAESSSQGSSLDEEQTPFLMLNESSSSGSGDKGEDNNGEESNAQQQQGFVAFLKALRDDILSYLNLLRYNRAFRLFLMSYIMGHMGEWFTYIASISLMERMLGSNNDGGASSRTSIGVLVMIRLLPTVVLSPFGGVLADSRDRRKSMIILDLIGACTPILFIVASLFEHTQYSTTYGVAMVYIATICQECVCALYEPCRTSIVPLLVTGNDNDLKKATTLTGVAWSAVAAFGSALGGFASSYFGARPCFCMDGCCYLLSAFLMWMVGGNWKVTPDNKYSSVWEEIKGMTVDGAKYLSSSFFGGLVFFKASCALVTGATNVLNVSLSERSDDGDDSSMWILKGMDTEQRLGILFSITGIGCILGPLIADPLTSVECPKALQLACIYGFMAVTVGCFGVGMFHPFWMVCVFSAIRSAGGGILWLDSQFLLQKFTAKEMLGRVAAVDEALATLAEALSSLLCGILQDRGNLTAERVSGAQAMLSFAFVIGWSAYHFAGRGAACPTTENSKYPMKKSS